MNLKKSEILQLADWLKHMHEQGSSLAHVPEMLQHLDNLKKWEREVRRLAQQTENPVLQHDWIKSTLGHGETMCSRCFITNREAAVLGFADTCNVPPPGSEAADCSKITGEQDEQIPK